MIDIGDILRTALNSHFAAGAAGGLVRSFYIKEFYSLAIIRALAGGISAHYVTPIILWLIPRYFEVGTEVSFNDPAGAAVSFAVGLMGIMLSTLIEGVIKRNFPS